MKIQGKPGERLSTTYLWLTRTEAQELRDLLDAMLRSDPDPAWHEHVSASNYQSELTVAWDMES